MLPKDTDDRWLVRNLGVTCPEPPPQKPAEINPAFEAATIKPHNPNIPGFGIRVIGHRLSTVNTSLSELMAFAYGLHAHQIQGGPPWHETEKYDLLAVFNSDGMPVRTMLQKLIADRFRLKFHRGNKKLTVYAVVVAKGGPKIENNAGDPNGNPSYGIRALGIMTVTNAKISDFAGWLQRYVLDRPVVDHTGISRRYTFTLSWRPDEFQFPDIGRSLTRPTDDIERPDLYTALREQLGLRLESTKANMEVLVIDHLEKPSDN